MPHAVNRSKGQTRGRLTLSISVAIIVLLTSLGQGSAQARYRFEVASVRSANVGMASFGFRIVGARAEFNGLSMLDLLCRAYQIKSFQVIGPEWIRTSRFNIVATLPKGASPADVPQMLGELVIERFNLSFHNRVKEMAVYSLIASNSGRKPIPYAASDALHTGFNPMTTAQLADYLSAVADRPVIDRANLQGRYRVSIERIRQVLSRQAVEHERMDDNNMSDSGLINASDLALSDIVREWGFTLVPTKASVPVLVIDHIDKVPKEN